MPSSIATEVPLPVPSNNAAAVYLPVPTIDIAPYLHDPTSAAAEIIINNIRTACLSTGFFQIVGHGIQASLQRSLFDASAAFFALPYEEKLKLDAKTTVGHRGYDVLASQSYEEGVMPDLKEGFYVGTNLPSSDPRVQARRFFMGENVWPPQALLPSVAFQEPVEAYYKAVYSLSLKVLEMIARTLPYGPHIFDDFTSDDPVAPLRLLHYPPAQKTEIRQLGASAHTDFGAITLLLQDQNPGLEVLDPASSTGAWVPIAPNPEAYVVNIGDMLSRWTNDQYKSSVHRVLNKNPTDRYSVVFFFDGNLDCRLVPLDGSAATKERDGDEGKGELDIKVDQEKAAAGDKVLTVEGHMIERFKSTYK